MINCIKNKILINFISIGLIFFSLNSLILFLKVYKKKLNTEENDFHYIYWSSNITSQLPFCERTFSHYSHFKPVMTIEDLRRISEMLKIIDIISHQANMKYLVMFGTRLGAFRHHGPIPYDDDIDIAILDEDRTKLDNLSINFEEYRISKPSVSDKWKFYYKKSKKIKGYDYGWPFLDIFFFKSMKNGKLCILADNLNFCVTPNQLNDIKRKPFLNLKIPILGPKTVDPNTKNENMKICMSRTFNHRIEKFERSAIIKLPCKKLFFAFLSSRSSQEKIVHGQKF